MRSASPPLPAALEGGGAAQEEREAPSLPLRLWPLTSAPSLQEEADPSRGPSRWTGPFPAVAFVTLQALPWERNKYGRGLQFDLPAGAQRPSSSVCTDTPALSPWWPKMGPGQTLQ